MSQSRWNRDQGHYQKQGHSLRGTIAWAVAREPSAHSGSFTQTWRKTILTSVVLGVPAWAIGGALETSPKSQASRVACPGQAGETQD